MLLLAVLLAGSLALSAEAQGVKGRPYAASPSQPRPFFGTKAKAASESREFALPAFVEPPPAPNPEPASDDTSEPGKPYSFSYTADGIDGRSARTETSDGTTVRGSYTLEGPDGISRVVHYIADRDGFRATIETNEPGTESQNPAAVLLNSSQLPASEIALQYGPGPREPLPSAPAAVIRREPIAALLSPAPLPVVAPLPLPLEPLPLREAVITPQFRAQPQILAPARQQPSNFGFRTEVRHEALPSARAQAVKGGAPSVVRQTLLQAPVKAPRPLPAQIQNFRAPAKAPPRPAPLPLLRTSGKQTLQKNPRPFFAPAPPPPPPPPPAQQIQIFDEPQQQREETEDQQVQVQEQEPEPAQQRETFLDDPQQKQSFFSRAR